MTLFLLGLVPVLVVALGPPPLPLRLFTASSVDNAAILLYTHVSYAPKSLSIMDVDVEGEPMEVEVVTTEESFFPTSSPWTPLLADVMLGGKLGGGKGGGDMAPCC